MCSLDYINIYRRGNKKWTIPKTGNIGYTRQRKTKQKHNTICVEHHYVQTNTNQVNMTRVLLQTTADKDEHRFYAEISF